MIRLADPPSKVCPACHRDLPIPAFRFRKLGKPGRQGSCRQCYNARMRGYRYVRRSKTIRGFPARVLRANGLEDVNRLCEEMFTRFGGAAGFAATWKAHMEAVAPGSPMALRSFLALMRLLQWKEEAEAQQRPADDFAVTQAEIDQEVQRLVSAEVQRFFGDSAQVQRFLDDLESSLQTPDDETC